MLTLTTAIESFREGLAELKQLLPGHYLELAPDQDKVPLSPRFDDYISMENAGELIYVTLRTRGKLAGYFIGFIRPGLHYSTCLTCNMDIFWLDPLYRGNGGGVILYEAVEKELRRRGVQRWMVSHKLKSPAAGELFKHLGFEPIETAFTKWIGS